MVKNRYHALGEKDPEKLGEARLKHDAAPAERITARSAGIDYIEAYKLENHTTGVMVHYVVEVDHGASILTQEIRTEDGESLEDLEQKVHGYEHMLIVRPTARLAEQIVSAKESTTA
ncbi:hypothetical protein F5X99DRAFT_411677 [Biscogniauxia marginata]|nr:hypothetical protein F5X99DRAFT_411677 [Biscogniauxia marginata]